MCYSCNSGYSSASVGYAPPSSCYSSSGSDYSGAHSIDCLVDDVEQSKGVERFVEPALYSKSYENQNYNLIKTPEYFSPTIFLEENRPLTQFIQDAEQIKDYILEAFRLTTGKELPNNIIISVCSDSDLARTHEYNGGRWDSAIQGFAINNPKLKRIFIKQNQLDKVLLTVGHELGHVLSHQLKDKKDEEAKAFAFSVAWMQAIKEHNIANIGNSIKLNAPAKNGLHNIALDFVLKLVNSGKKALDIHKDLIKNLLSVNPIHT